MSRRKQARPKSCKAEDQESDLEDVVKVKVEDEDDMVINRPEEDFVKDEEDSNRHMDLLSQETRTNVSSLKMTSAASRDVVAETISVAGTKEMRCESCGLQFESLSKFMDHRNNECRAEKNDLKSTNWLLQESSNVDSISPSSISTSGGADETFVVGAGEETSEGGGIGLDDLDPNDIPFAIGVSNDNPYGCTFCEKAFSFLSHLHRHEQTHTAQMPYKCAHCSRQFRHEKSRDRHERLHSADRKYKCKVCGVGYSRSDHLRNHMKNHDLTGKGDNCKCSVCSLSFSSPLALSNHMKKQHTDRESPDSLRRTQHSCIECHQLFASDQEAGQHVCPALGDDEHLRPADQASIQELKCPVCSDVFSSMESLCHHLMCHRTLNLETNSKISMDMSSGFGVGENNKENRAANPESQTSSNNAVTGGSSTSNPLVCPYCLIEGFESLESLELHLTSVHNVKPTEVYTCNYCNAPYPNLYSLHDHMTVVHRSQHGLDITYPCSMCVQRFHSLDALAKHKGIVHSQHHSSGIDAAFCNRCNMTLSSPRSLEDHMATVHNIIMDKKTTKTKGKKSMGKNNSKGTVTPHKSASSVSSKTTPPWTSKKQSGTSPSSLSSTLTKIPNSSSSSSSLATSPVAQSSATTSPSYALAYAMNEAVQASSALRITALLAKKGEQNLDSIESAGMTCDHCNATFHDVQNFSAHLLLHTGSLFTSPAPLDKWSSETSSVPREGAQIATGSSPRAGSRSGSTSGDASDTRKSHECFKCQTSFSSSDQLETHILLHYLRVNTEYGCSSCSKNFSKPDELQRHLMDIHAHHLYRCSLCKEIFDSKVNIQVHFAIKHSDECKLYRCVACDLSFSSEMEWQVHVRVNHLHISRPYRCLFCQESFTSEVELQCHLTTHSKPFVCPMCSQAFHIEYLLDQHMQQHHGDVKPNLTQQVPSRSSPSTPLSLLIPTTVNVKQEKDQETETNSGYESPSLSPLSSSSQNCILPSSSPLLSKTILKPPTVSALGKLAHNPHSQVLSSSPRIESSGSGSSAIPTVWKNAEPLHMCNICDIKFNDFSLLMMHKAQDHDLKNIGKAAEKALDEELTSEKKNHENILLNNEVLLSALANTASCNSQNGQATPSHVVSATPLSCMFCSQTFKNNVDYEKHMKIHVNSGNLTCSICDETFSSPSVLAEHKLMHCKIQQGNTCVVCRVTLCSKDQFYSHSQEHGFEGTQLQCVVCRQSLSSLVELQMHGRHHFQPRASFFTCCVCLKTFESKENLVSKLNSSGRTYYVCKPCYHGEAAPLHTCSQCSEKFATAQLLEIHMLTHKSSFQCIKCQQSFSSEYEIQLHVATHLMNEGAQHECRLCGTSCDTPARLQTHLIQHSFSDTDIACFVCNKVFESPQEIQVHVLEHSSSYKKYSCAKCPQKFFFSAELENHKLTYNHFTDTITTAVDGSSLKAVSSGQPPQSSKSSSPSNFHASALLASLSASPHSTILSELSQSTAHLSKLHSSSKFKKDGSSSVSKQKSSSTSSSSSSKIMKLDMGKTQGFGSVGALTIPKVISSSSSSSRRLECSDCLKVFTTGTALANHRKTHLRKEVKNTVKCSLCDETFPSATSMQQHFFSTHSPSIKKEEKKPTFECMMCEKACATLGALQNHILSHRTRTLGSFSTENDPKHDSSKSESDHVTRNAQQVESMEKIETEDDSGDTGSEDTSLLACPVCNQVFLNAEDIDDHIKTHEELFITQSNELEGTNDVVEKQDVDKAEDVGMDVTVDSRIKEEKMSE